MESLPSKTYSCCPTLCLRSFWQPDTHCSCIVIYSNILLQNRCLDRNITLVFHLIKLYNTLFLFLYRSKEFLWNINLPKFFDALGGLEACIWCVWTPRTENQILSYVNYILQQMRSTLSTDECVFFYNNKHPKLQDRKNRVLI